MRGLKLPPTVRTPEPEEIPAEQSLLSRLEARRNANIVEGYSLKLNTTTELPFQFFSEINVDNETLWPLFVQMVMEMPDDVALIYHHADHEPVCSDYLHKIRLINILEPYQQELTKDPFLEFGVIHHVENYLTEVYIQKCKYIQYWGMNQQQFRNTMNEFGIYEIPGISFIDEFPLVRESLQEFLPDAVETSDLLDKIKAALAS